MTEQQKYRVVERVDSGGMAEVFKGIANIRDFEKVVAIKRILPSLTQNPKFVAMFLDEARLALYLTHANIVQVFDLGVADNTYFIVMEYVEGVTLKRIVERAGNKKGKILPVEQAIYISMEICKGLAYAHEMKDPRGRPLNIVHRDVSPPNILISDMGEVKLVDFGLAKAASQVESTDPGVVKGKFSYLSPEAAYGETVDHRADIFATGILLFEMLTGRRLFLGQSDLATVELVREAQIPPLKKFNKNVTDALERVVRKALARDVNDRYQSSRALEDDLATVLFENGMKVTSRDIAALVRNVRAATKSKAKPELSIIDQFILEEVGRFESLEGKEGLGGEQFDAAKPLSVNDLGATQSGDPQYFDPRNWAKEFNDSDGVALPSPDGHPHDHDHGWSEGGLEEMLEGGDPVLADAAPHSSKIRFLIILFLVVCLGVAAALLVVKGGLLDGLIQQGATEKRIEHYGPPPNGKVAPVGSDG